MNFYWGIAQGLRVDGRGQSGYRDAQGAPGTYPVYSQAASTSVMGNVAIVFYAATDAACATTADYESVSGSFTTTVCPALATSIGGTCT